MAPPSLFDADAVAVCVAAVFLFHLVTSRTSRPNNKQASGCGTQRDLISLQLPFFQLQNRPWPALLLLPPLLLLLRRSAAAAADDDDHDDCWRLAEFGEGETETAA